MNDDLQEALPDTEDAEEDRASDISPQPLSRSLIIALGLVGILVLLIIFVNVPGIRASASVSITRSDWILQSYADTSGTLIPLGSGTPVTAIFDSNASVSGSGGCNSYRANYTVRDFSIYVSPPVSTTIFCHDPGVMHRESAYLNDLVQAEELRISESDLILYDGSGKPVLVFVKDRNVPV